MKKKPILLSLPLVSLFLAAALLVSSCTRAPQPAESETPVAATERETTAPEIPEEPGPVFYSYADIVRRLTDPRFLAEGYTGERSAEFSSYSRDSAVKNGVYTKWDANGDGSQYIKKTADGGYLLAEMKGPGYISRIWSATPGTGRVKIYLDGAETPTFDLPFQSYFSGKKEPFVYPELIYQASEGSDCYLPITYNVSCRVVAYGEWGKYYQIHYTTLKKGDSVESMTAALSEEGKAALREVCGQLAACGNAGAAGADDAPFESFTVTKNAPVRKTLTGRGAVSAILVRLPDTAVGAPETVWDAVETLKALRLRIRWDGEEEPSVDAPLGDFFGSGYGFDKASTLFLGVREDRTLYCYYYMPYRAGAEIEISSCLDRAVALSLAVSVSENTVPGGRGLYFHALYSGGAYVEDRNRRPDHRFLLVKGEGRFVGLALHVSQLKDGTDPAVTHVWWGEGDEKFFVDGEAFPSWFGTGTEDFFGYAWCSPLLFTRPYHAQGYCTGRSNYAGNRSLLRLLVTDSVPFSESFDGCLEKYYGDEYVRCGYTSYFYLSGEGEVVTEALSPEETLSRFRADPSAYASAFTEGEHLYPVSASGAGSAAEQQMTGFGISWSGYAQLFGKGVRVGDRFEWILPAEREGRFVLLASFTSAPDYGKVRCEVNGTALGGELDLYASSVCAEGLVELGTVALKGNYADRIALVSTGKNARSSAWNFGLDFLLLIPEAEYEGIGKVDLSRYTDVYRENTAQVLSGRTQYLIEGEDKLKNAASVSAGSVRAQAMTTWGSAWSGGSQLFWAGGAQGSTLTLYFSVEAEGDYQATAFLTKAGDYGKISFLLNGKAVGGEFDGYAPSVTRSSLDLGTLHLKAGPNQLRIRLVGKNASASNYYVGFDCIRLTAVR
ncbi:MAG: DUF2961 domain-containing protein [Clostridia bacterium]|nr:DUF2961 domain-containing protein [Clostridia bacterium]